MPSERYIDCHTHPYELNVEESSSSTDAFEKVAQADCDNLLDGMDEAGVEKSIILGLDLETTRNFKFGNDDVKSIVDRYPDRFIGFCSVDPHKGILAIAELQRSIEELKLSGLKLHPILQEFYPNSKEIYPIYRIARDYAIPILFDSGQTFVKGYIKYGNPILLDDVAVDFPDLKIIIAHFGWPWMHECISLAWTHKNVYIDLAGWSPKYLPQSLLKYINSLLSKKTLFGTDYPFISQKRWIKEFKELGLKEETEALILGENARNILEI